MVVGKAHELRQMDKEEIANSIKERWEYGVLAAIFAIALSLRYMPESGMAYLQAADPYMIFRMSQHIALEGGLPPVDFSRYFPYSTPTYIMNQGDYFIPALLYEAGFSLFFENYLEWGQFYPALMGAASTVAMYFFGKELFNKRTGLIAAFFLATIPGVLRRTSAGFFEKEPLGTFMMMTSLLFFTRAWKRESWPNGIISGIALGIFTISWGGVDIIYYTYPIIIGAVLFLNEDINSMVSAYTPTILLGAFIGAIINPNRFWFTSNLFLANIALLGALWMRYAVSEFDIIEQKYMPYFIPSLGFLGGLMALLSPLYSGFIARKVLGIYTRVFGSGGGVIGGTVQENAPPRAGDLVSSLGSLIQGVNPLVDYVASAVSPWTLMMFGTPFMMTYLILMVGRKYSLVSETISGKKWAAYCQSIFVAWLIFIAGMLQNSLFLGIFGGLVMATTLLALVYFLEETIYSITTLILGSVAVGMVIFVIRFSSGINGSLAQLTLLPALLAVLASLLIYEFDYFPERKIGYKWSLFIPVVWITVLIFGGTDRSRLVFLSTFAVSLPAGYAMDKILRTLQQVDYSSITEELNPKKLKIGLISLILLIFISTNLFTGIQMSIGIQNFGSPSPSAEIWEPSTNFMENKAEEGSTVLSWWDYGYHFQTLGRTASIGDGGNFGYYTSEQKINFPLAEYLNSTVENDEKFMDKHSADYIWLDQSMIGKFQAVSQIANRDNQQYESIAQFRTQGSLRDSISRNSNNEAVLSTKGSVVAQIRGRTGLVRGQVFTPVNVSQSSIDISDASTFRASTGESFKINCLLRDDGSRETFESDGKSISELTGQEYCVSEAPFYSFERGAAGGSSRLLLIPEKISDSTFVELYIQDGNNVPYAEKIPEASNSYIKMWKIEE